MDAGVEQIRHIYMILIDRVDVPEFNFTKRHMLSYKRQNQQDPFPESILQSRTTDGG